MNIFSFIKSRISIADVIGEYVSLKPAGRYLKGQCPLHSEKTASFTVSPDKDIFYCFGCHEGGDIISFIGLVERCSAMDAVHHLADKYSIEIPEELTKEHKGNVHEKKHYYELCVTMSQWCHEQLLRSRPAQEYLAARGINQKSINRYKLGYFPGGLASVKQFIDYMAKHNVLLTNLLDNHILNRSQKIIFSPFEERIIFPIADHLGNYCGFGGRIFKEHDTRPKYYNSHENEFFIKGSITFGLPQAKKTIAEKRSVFLVEGYLDCIALSQHGYEHTIATLGTACSIEHLNLLARYAESIVLLYDGDNAGQQALLRIALLCWQANVDIHVIPLPTGEDPASLAGKKELKDILANPIDIFTFFINQMTSDFQSKGLSQKLKIVHQITQIIEKLDDPIKQDLLLAQASASLGLSVNSLKDTLKKGKSSPQAPKRISDSYSALQLEPEVEAEQGTLKPIGTLEKQLFCAILNDIQLFTPKRQEFLITYLPNPICGILKKIQKQLVDFQGFDFNSFFSELEPSEQQFTSNVMVVHTVELERISFVSLFDQLYKTHWKMKVHDIKQKMQIAKEANDHAQLNELVAEFTRIKNDILAT